MFYLIFFCLKYKKVELILCYFETKLFEVSSQNNITDRDFFIKNILYDTEICKIILFFMLNG